MCLCLCLCVPRMSRTFGYIPFIIPFIGCFLARQPLGFTNSGLCFGGSCIDVAAAAAHVWMVSSPLFQVSVHMYNTKAFCVQHIPSRFWSSLNLPLQSHLRHYSPRLVVEEQKKKKIEKKKEEKAQNKKNTERQRKKTQPECLLVCLLFGLMHCRLTAHNGNF